MLLQQSRSGERRGGSAKASKRGDEKQAAGFGPCLGAVLMGLDDRLAVVERNPEKAGGSTGHGGAPVTSASGRAEEAENFEFQVRRSYVGRPWLPAGRSSEG